MSSRLIDLPVCFEKTPKRQQQFCVVGLFYPPNLRPLNSKQVAAWAE